MKKINIEALIDKYFEGETSSQEEGMIRKWFREEEIPEYLIDYQPLFAYFDEEIEQLEKEQNVVLPTRRRKLYYWFSGVAAALLLLVGLQQMIRMNDPCLCGNYVVINGKCYTDSETIRTFIFESLSEVADPAENYLSFEENEQPEKRIIEEQLKELGTLFSEDD